MLVAGGQVAGDRAARHYTTAAAIAKLLCFDKRLLLTYTASPVAFEASSYVTGTTIVVDGGYTVW